MNFTSIFRSFVLPIFLCATLQAQKAVPVVVELFTSEGCSSCPPADRLVAELEKTQPIANVEIIVLSEHVDYWDRLGWKDPFSSPTFTNRQQLYAKATGSDDVYTPEAVIDGIHTAVGSNRQSVARAVTVSGAKPKPDLELSIQRDRNTLLVSVPAGADDKQDIWVAVTQAKSISHVERGENRGSTLEHVGTVRFITKLKGTDAKIQIQPDWALNLRVVAFVQEKGNGRILQAVQQKLELGKL